MRTRRFTLVALVVGIPLTAMVAVALASQRVTPAGLTTMSSLGTPVTPTGQESAILTRTETLGGLNLLSTLAGRQYYRLTPTGAKRPGTCVGIGNRGDSLNMIECSTAFPATRPVLDASVFAMNKNTGAVQVTRIQGWAADAVSTISAVNASGVTVGETSVVNNAYALAQTELHGVAVTIVGIDKDGQIVFSKTV